MKRLLFAAAILALGFVSKAQDKDPEQDKKKMGDYDEIIIKKKDVSKDGKVTIEIKDQQVTVNGKPIEDYDGDDFVVKKHHPLSFDLNYSENPFRLDHPLLGDDNDMDMGPGVEKAFLGVMAEATEEGAKIREVTENSAAEKAGLKKGDVITRINDATIKDHEQLTGVIATMKPKDKVTITYKRDGKENKTTAVLGGRKISRARTFNPRGPMGRYAPGDMNMPPMNFNFDNPDLQILLHGKPRLGIKAQDTEEGKGVKVLEVDDDSPAGKAGLKENDIITSFEGKEVNSADDLAKASRESKDKSTLRVQVKRDGKSQSLEIKIPKKLKTADL